MTTDRLGQLERRVQQLEEEIRVLKERSYASSTSHHFEVQGNVNDGWQQQSYPSSEEHYSQYPHSQEQHNQNDQSNYTYHPHSDAQYVNQPPHMNVHEQNASSDAAWQTGQLMSQEQGYGNPNPNQTFGSLLQPIAGDTGSNYHHSSEVPPFKPKAVSRPPRDLENILVKIWLPRVFIIVLLLGVLWGFLAAVKEGYFTEAVRCWIGAIAAGVMYLAGVRQIQKDRAALGKVLVGGAQAVFIITISAAHLLYELIPIWFAVVAYLFAVVITIWMSLKWNSQTLIVLSTLSGYLFPFLIDSTSPSAFLFVTYQLLFSIVVLVIATKNKYAVAYWFAFGMLHCALLIAILTTYIEEIHIVMGAVVIQHIALFVLFVWRHRNAIEQSIMQLLAFFLLSMWGAALYHFEHPMLYTLILIISMLLYAWAAYYLYQLAKGNTAHNDHRNNMHQRVAISIALVNLAIFLLIIDQFNYSYGVIAVFVQGIVSILLSIRIRYWPQRIIGIIVTSLAALNIFVMLPTSVISEETLNWLVLLVGIPVLYLGSLKLLDANNREQYKKTLVFLLWAESILGLIFLTMLVDLLTEKLSDDLGHFIMSGAWLLYALVAIVIGIVWKKAKARVSGIIMLFVILIKVLFVDLPEVSLTVRALIFIMLGVVGIIASRVLYSNKSDSIENEEVTKEKEK